MIYYMLPVIDKKYISNVINNAAAADVTKAMNRMVFRCFFFTFFMALTI